MRKLWSKLTCFVLAFAMVLSATSTAFAAGLDSTSFTSAEIALSSLPELQINEATLSKSSDPIVQANSDEIIEAANMFKFMSIDELNDYIDSAAANFDSTQTTTVYGVETSSVTTILELKTLWLAAAQAAKLKGYNCAAKSVEYSVLDINYTENTGAEGLFRDKIVATSVYKNFLSNFKKSNKSSISQVKEFTKSDNSDLFYALHNATITIKKTGSTCKVNAYDVFDFAFDNNYDSLFASLVKNWAWLCQQTYALNAIKINVNFAV